MRPAGRRSPQVVAKARDAGLLVIADAKRGDVDVSARAYAQAFLGETPSPFGPIPGLGADAMTVSPWLGGDSLEPFIDAARERGAGLFVLVRNSNPGAVELQDRGAGAGGTVSDAAARMIAALGVDGIGESGLSRRRRRRRRDRPRPSRTPARADAARGLPAARASAPRAGASMTSARCSPPVPPAALISVSRGIVHAHRMTGGDPAAAARREAAAPA